MQYFIDNSLIYDIIPEDCRTNNFLENYNGYIKLNLGKHRIINWVNFIHFIKSESSRSIEKLLNSVNYNVKSIKKISEKKEFKKSTNNSVFTEIKSKNIDLETNKRKFILTNPVSY